MTVLVSIYYDINETNNRIVGDGLLLVMNIISEFRIFQKSLEYLPGERHI